MKNGAAILCRLPRDQNVSGASSRRPSAHIANVTSMDCAGRTPLDEAIMFIWYGEREGQLMRLSQALAKMASFSAFPKLPLLFPFLFPTTHSSGGADVHRHVGHRATYGQEPPLCQAPKLQFLQPSCWIGQLPMHIHMLPRSREPASRHPCWRPPDRWKARTGSETATYVMRPCKSCHSISHLSQLLGKTIILCILPRCLPFLSSRLSRLLCPLLLLSMCTTNRNGSAGRWT